MSSSLSTKFASGRPGRLLKNRLTHSEFKLLWRYKDSNPGLRCKHLAQPSIASKSLEPHVYCADSSLWVSWKLSQIPCNVVSLSKLCLVISTLPALGPAERASAAMEHLEEYFGDTPESLVVMLQGVRDESLHAILENTWVQRNFAVSDIQAPQSI